MTAGLSCALWFNLISPRRAWMLTEKRWPTRTLVHPNSHKWFTSKVPIRQGCDRHRITPQNPPSQQPSVRVVLMFLFQNTIKRTPMHIRQPFSSWTTPSSTRRRVPNNQLHQISLASRCQILISSRQLQLNIVGKPLPDETNMIATPPPIIKPHHQGNRH